MKRFNFYWIFIIVSVGWLAFFTYNFVIYNRINQELNRIEDNLKDVENIRFYERTVRSLELEFENASRQSFTSKSTSEFIATLPKIGELTGLDRIKIESQGVTTENDLEITVLKVSTSSLFPQIANFIDFMERSKLPIQISSLSMKFTRSKLETLMVLRIYKKNIED